MRFCFCCVFLALWLVASGCGGPGSEDQGGLEQSFRTSGCDGFAANGSSFFSPLPFPPENYCDAEILFWRYDAPTSTLGLLDQRAFLNCCGEHSMKIVLGPDGYQVTEKDDPGDLGRCA